MLCLDNMPPAAASRVTRMRNDAQGIIVDTEALEENTRLHLSVHIRLPVLSNILAAKVADAFSHGLDLGLCCTERISFWAFCVA